MRITATAFSDGDRIASKYTCDSDNENPALIFSDVPEKAKTLALIVDDPDAPARTFTHWLVWNIDATTDRIDEGSVPGEAVEGMTDFGVTGYGGPCPPASEHRYFFRVYALDKELDLEEGSTREQLEEAMIGHTLDSAELMCLYARGNEFGGRLS